MTNLIITLKFGSVESVKSNYCMVRYMLILLLPYDDYLDQLTYKASIPTTKRFFLGSEFDLYCIYSIYL